MIKKKAYYILLFVLLGLVASLSLFIYFHIEHERNSVSMIVVNKNDLLMNVINLAGDTIRRYPVAVGTNKGNKQNAGDLKTPEGVFLIEATENSSAWTYDFENDDKGPVDGAYGPWFIRLNALPHKGIGIHGTHDNSSIGKRVSHGCVRMQNKDLVELVSMIKPGIPVYITKDIIKDTLSKK